MRRREFVTFVVGATATWPLAVRAQQPAAPTIGFLNPASPTEFAYRVVAFRNGLAEMGYAEDQNVKIEYRWGQINIDCPNWRLISFSIRWRPRDQGDSRDIATRMVQAGNKPKFDGIAFE